MKFRLSAIAIALTAGISPSIAAASLILDKVVVDLQSGAVPREDIELTNEGDERMYVDVQPFEIQHPDTSEQSRVAMELADDPLLLVSPRRLVLDPGERRLVRIALIGPRPDHELTYRVRIEPVVGEILSDQDGLKVMVGYDTLVIVRATSVEGSVVFARSGNTIQITNNSNTSFEYFNGKACSESYGQCRDLPPNRLYPGEVWELQATKDEKVEFVRANGGRLEKIEFNAH